MFGSIFTHLYPIINEVAYILFIVLFIFPYSTDYLDFRLSILSPVPVSPDKRGSTVLSKFEVNWYRFKAFEAENFQLLD